MPLSWRPIWARVRAKVHQSPTLLFGVPFVSSIVVGSFFLAQLTQTRYEQHDAKVRALTQEEKLHLQRDRKPLDIREEYFKLQSRADELDDWEPKRVARPVGMPEWGGVPAPAPEGREAVREDLDAHSRSSFFARRKPIEAEERPASERETAPPPPKATRKPPVVLGPDGKPCRACSSKLAFGAALRNVTKRSPCPPDVEELGHSTRPRLCSGTRCGRCWMLCRTCIHARCVPRTCAVCTLQASRMRHSASAPCRMDPAYAHGYVNCITL